MMKDNKIIIIVDGGQITDICLSPALEGLEIQIVDHDKQYQTTTEKEDLFHELNKSLINV